MPALKRLLAMDRAQAGFRARGELRKLRERAAMAVSAPHWNRRRLADEMRELPDAPHWNRGRTALKSGDYRGAHEALAHHFSQRASAFPLDPRGVPAVAAQIAAAFPHALADAVGRADSIVGGHYDLLGYRHVPVAAPIDWHRDPIHDRRAPIAHWASVPYLDPAHGDHKIIWELNRHQHWLALGRAYALSGRRTYYDAFRAQLRGWLGTNPPLSGVNWASMLELGFRTLSWLWATTFFAGAARNDGPSDEPWLVDVLLGITEQLTHVERNLSLYFSPNTHLTGEALALYVAGCALPGLRPGARWAGTGREVLLAELRQQVLSDGGHAERSGHYHRYSTDFYLLALTVARRHQDAVASEFEESARHQARYLRTISDDSGRRPAFGDDDGGQLFPICGRAAEDCRDTLAIASVLLEQPELALGPPPEEAYWLCGGRVARAAAGATAPWPSAALTSTGYYVSRTASRDHLVFDAGAHGFINGGHAHSDALSVVLTVGGKPLLVDPGTATYTMDPAVRDRFRGTAMHNTLVLDGRPQSQPRGPFHWQSAAAAQAQVWRSMPGCDYVEGTHDGYLPIRHTRSILAIHGTGWWIVDHVLGDGEHDAEIYWHLHPDWRADVRGGCIALRRHDGTELALATTAAIDAVVPGTTALAVWSPAYGLIEPAPVLIARVRGPLPQSIATFIPASAAFAANLALERLPIAVKAAGWHAGAWRAIAGGSSTTLLAAIEKDGLAASDKASPGVRWGTADVQTDGRVAALADHRGGTKSFIVNGSGIAPVRELADAQPNRRR